MRTLMTVLTIAAVFEAAAQSRSASSAKPFGPLLTVESSLHADGGDAVLEAGEHARVRVMVTNRGSAAATDAALRVSPQSACVGVSMAERHQIGTLDPGASREIVLEFAVADSVPRQQVGLLLQAEDGTGRIHPVDTLHFSTLRSLLPRFQLAWTLEHPDLGILDAAAPGDTLFLVLRLYNRGGVARNVSLHLEEHTGVRPLDWTDTLLVVGDLAGGDSLMHRVLVAIARTIPRDTIRVGVAVLEQRSALTRRWVIVCRAASPARLMVRRGTAAFERGEIERALASYTEAVRKDPSLAQAHLLQGLVYEYLGDKKRCIPAIRRAAELGDSTAMAWLKQHEQVRGPRVEYVRLQPDPFQDAEQGAGLAILPFDREEGSDVAERVYRKLAASPKARGRFTLYSASSLAEQQDALGLSSLDPESEAVRSALRAVDIRYVLYGAVAEESPLAITVRCIRTDDGVTLVEQELRESSASTALDDAVRLIAEGRKPVYRKR